MGIGRFSLTPILPLMQQDAHLTLAVGGWLATGNYIGYLVGALGCILLTPRAATSIRWGLVGVGLTTLLMGFSEWAPLWLALRFLAGVASAFVLVGTSAWAMPILRQHGREDWSAHVFSGVGIGIAFAGLFGLAAGIDAWSSRITWIVLGIVAIVLAALLWRPLGNESAPAIASRRAGRSRVAAVRADCRRLLRRVRLRLHHSRHVPAGTGKSLYRRSPRCSAWSGRCSARLPRSRPLPARLLGRSLAPRQLWTRAKWVLAAGVALPAIWINVPTLLLSAVCVGGTFMIITMAGIKEALRLGGAPASLAVGVMTAAFGAGQIVGPLMVSLLARSGHAFALASFIAAASLIAGNLVLLFFDRPAEPLRI